MTLLAPEPTSASNDLLTPDEVARILKVKRRTIYAWVKSGRIPAFKYGKRLWRIERGDVRKAKG